MTGSSCPSQIWNLKRPDIVEDMSASTNLNHNHSYNPCRSQNLSNEVRDIPVKCRPPTRSSFLIKTQKRFILQQENAQKYFVLFEVCFVRFEVFIRDMEIARPK